MILIFSDTYGQRIATPNWTVEENKNKKRIEISYCVSMAESVVEEPYHRIIAIDMRMHDFVNALHSCSHGICNICQYKAVDND